MALYLPKKVVLNWYQYDVSFSTVLIDAFVEGTERQALKSIVNYEKEKRREIVEGQLVYVHEGLDSETWDLAGIFEEYFPSLQRRSALVTLCSYFEHELDQLCSLYQNEKSFRLALSDVHGTGLDRATTYLEKVAGLDLHKSSPVWNNIKDIQTIRNCIVHRGGRLLDHQGNPYKDTANAIKRLKHLSGDDEIVVEGGFLSYVVGTYKTYFKLIGESINGSEHVYPERPSSKERAYKP